MTNTIKGISRPDYPLTRNPSLEDIRTGSLQRIASACEAMAADRHNLERSRDYWKQMATEGERREAAAARRIAALKGVITRLRRQARRDASAASQSPNP